MADSRSPARPATSAEVNPRHPQLQFEEHAMTAMIPRAVARRYLRTAIVYALPPLFASVSNRFENG